MSSGAQLEAIAAGCATVSVSSEPTADRWRANGDVASSILDPAVVPAIPPEAFWPLLNTFVEDRSQLDILFTRQLAWFARRARLAASLAFSVNLPGKNYPCRILELAVRIGLGSSSSRWHGAP